MIKQGSVLGIGRISALRIAVATATLCIAVSAPTFAAGNNAAHHALKAKASAVQTPAAPAADTSTNNEAYAAYTRSRMMAATPKYYGLPMSDAQRKFR